MGSPINYSKWKDIDISDDEDDTHPNIEKASLFRMRHQSRVEKMVESRREMQSVEVRTVFLSSKCIVCDESLKCTESVGGKAARPPESGGNEGMDVCEI